MINNHCGGISYECPFVFQFQKSTTIALFHWD